MANRCMAALGGVLLAASLMGVIGWQFPKGLTEALLIAILFVLIAGD